MRVHGIGIVRGKGVACSCGRNFGNNVWQTYIIALYLNNNYYVSGLRVKCVNLSTFAHIHYKVYFRYLE